MSLLTSVWYQYQYFSNIDIGSYWQEYTHIAKPIRYISISSYQY